MGQYKCYSDYVDSGVEWLGKIPQHWQVKRLGSFFTERREKVSDEDYPALSVTKDGIVPQLETAAKTDAGDNRKLVRKNDFVINSRSDRKGSSGVSKLEGSVSLISIVMEPTNIEPEYAHHLLRSYSFQEEFYRHGKGIVADLWSTNSSEMKNIMIPKFSKAEQQQIAKFLDHEILKINELIEKQKNLISFINEKRLAVINHAVTKGLNSNVSMKDSGVEWLGAIPKHWGFKKIKHLVKISNGLDYKSVETDEPGYPVIGSGGQFRYANQYLYDKESVLLGRKGTIDKPLYINEPFWTVDTMFYTQIFEGTFAKFFYYCAQTIKFDYYATSTALPSMTQEDLNNIYFPFPSLSEQREIASYLDIEMNKSSNLIEKSSSVIKLLIERRNSLISSAVTGKIDVRDWQPANQIKTQKTNKSTEEVRV